VITIGANAIVTFAVNRLDFTIIRRRPLTEYPPSHFRRAQRL